MTTINETYGSPIRQKPQQMTQLPDSPDDGDHFTGNSDDLQPTSNLQSPMAPMIRQRPLVVVGSHEKTITLGRGGSNTIKIGRRNRQISRTHVSIAYNKDLQQFQLTVIGLNGACVDHVAYQQNEVARLDNESLIDIVGDRLHFRVPPPPLNFNISDMKKNVNVNKKDIFAEEEEEAESPLVVIDSPPPQEQQQKEEEGEQEYPKELVPEEALSPVDEKELSPEPVAVIEQAEEITVVEKKEDIIVKTKQQQPLQEKKSNIVQETAKVEENKKKEIVEVEEDTTDYAQVIIDALVFSRTSSMPISDICSRILKSNPVYAKQPRQLWIERIRTVLKNRPFFGEITRKGKTADGSPVENLYYYNSELDPVEWRRSTYTQVGRSARKCTLQDKQYFWKIPPKLGRHRSSYIPPPATASTEKRQHVDENVDPSHKKTKY